MTKDDFELERKKLEANWRLLGIQAPAGKPVRISIMVAGEPLPAVGFDCEKGRPQNEIEWAELFEELAQSCRAETLEDPDLI